jgi:hypothetical protein
MKHGHPLDPRIRQGSASHLGLDRDHIYHSAPEIAFRVDVGRQPNKVSVSPGNFAFADVVAATLAAPGPLPRR